MALRVGAVSVVLLASGAHAFCGMGRLVPVRSSPRMHAHALRMRTEQSKDDSLAASVNRRAALVTAAALALELRSPAPAHAAGATMTMTVNTFEGVKGDVVFELYPDLAPKTVERFKEYANSGLYDGSAFFRVARYENKGVLLAGDPSTREERYCVADPAACAIKYCYPPKDGGGEYEIPTTCTPGKWYGPDGYITSASRKSDDDNGNAAKKQFGKGGPAGFRFDGLSKTKLEPEFGKLPHEKGVISMRRFKSPEYAGSQFIICMSDMKAELDGSHAAFGRVTQGIELLDKIMTVETVKADKLKFPRDDKQKEAVWPADNFPATRQGIDKIVVK